MKILSISLFFIVLLGHYTQANESTAPLTASFLYTSIMKVHDWSKSWIIGAESVWVPILNRNCKCIIRSYQGFFGNEYAADFRCDGWTINGFNYDDRNRYDAVKNAIFDFSKKVLEKNLLTSEQTILIGK